MGPVVMLDTSSWNQFWEHQDYWAVVQSAGVRILATHIQLEELSYPYLPQEKQSWLKQLCVSTHEFAPTASTICGKSRCGASSLSDGRLFAKLREEISSEDRKRRKNGSATNDALIAETAISLGVPCITEDGSMRKVLCDNGATCYSLKEYIALLKSVGSE